MPSGLSAVGLDIVLTSTLLAWLLWRPVVLPMVMLILLQVLSLVVNIDAIAATQVNSLPFKALLVHIVLRLLIIGFGIAFVVRARQEAASA